MKRDKKVLSEILNILELNDKQQTFYLRDFDNDLDKQNKILSLENDIKKYYKYGSWGCFACNNIKRKVLSMIKNVVKDMNYNVIITQVFRKTTTGSKRDSLYYIIKKP